MKTALSKDTFRSIKSTANRFISIFVIIALGVGFFTGLKATCPDMLDTGNKYFSMQNLVDIRVLSTLGFDDEDIDKIAKIEGVETVMPAYFTDVFCEDGSSQTILRVHSTDLEKSINDSSYINQPLLVEGRLPEKSGECVIEQDVFGIPDIFKIGNTITLSSEDDISNVLKTTQFEIVGIVNSPYYISFDRGNTTVGNGQIDNYIIIPSIDFSMRAYSELHLKVKGTQSISEYDDIYQQLVDDVISNIEDQTDTLGRIRYEKVLSEANIEIANAQKEIDDAQSQLNQAKAKLENARKEIEDGEQQLNNEEKLFIEKITSSWNKINSGSISLTKGIEEYNKSLKQYIDAVKIADVEIPLARQQIKEKYDELEQARTQLDEAQNQLDIFQKLLYTAQKSYNLVIKELGDIDKYINLIEEHLDKYPGWTLEKFLEIIEKNYPDQIKQFKEILEKYDISTNKTLREIYDILSSNQDKIIAYIRGLQKELDNAKEQLVSAQKELDKNKLLVKEGEQELRDAEKLLNEKESDLKSAGLTLESAKKKLTESEKELLESKNLLISSQAEGQEKINNARKELEDGKKKLEDGEKEFNEQSGEAQKKIDEAREKLGDAQKQLNDLALPTWYITGRDSIPGHAEYGENAQRIDAIAQVFPVFFFIIAIFVCLTTMTRMVEEDRTQIGTLKALGYSKTKIISKYLIYAILAGVGGAVLGLAIGFKFFPTIIINAYKIMYCIPVDVILPFRIDYTVVGLSVAVACTGGAVVLSCYKELLSNAAVLMRPKSPKNGKRILLERVPFLWKRLSFSKKVTARNIFRYKKRLFMTLFGIMGCTALLLTGFGLKYSISGMINKQFVDIMNYDLQVVLKSGINPDNKNVKLAFLDDYNEIDQSLLTSQKNYQIGNYNKKIDTTLFVPEDTQSINNLISFHDRKTKEKFLLNDDGVIITEKLALLMDLKVGDDIYIKQNDTQQVSLKISAITENYLNHYVYISPDIYGKTFNQQPDYEILMITCKQGISFDKDDLANRLLSNDEIIGFVFIDAIQENFSDIMKSLNSVVVILIISAAALAFVVLYNLSNININERIREVATIKVLGFYDGEVSAYMYRENILLTIMGTIAGLAFGIILESFIITTAEVETVMFLRDINPASFIFSAALTLLFALIVNIGMHFQLKKIKMVESLKSVE